MNEFRDVLGKEFEITPQVRYDAAFMSRPEFVTYYRESQGHKVSTGAGRILTEIFDDLKEDAINIGVDRTLRKSCMTTWRRENYVEPPKKKDGRGRPKGSTNK